MQGLRLHDTYTLSERDGYKATLDDFRRGDGAQMLLIHIDVDPAKFSPSKYKQLIHEWNVFRSCTDADVFAMEPNPDDKKWERFVSPLELEYSSRVECSDTLTRRLFVSRKNKNNNVRLQYADDEPVADQ